MEFTDISRPPSGERPSRRAARAAAAFVVATGVVATGAGAVVMVTRLPEARALALAVFGAGATLSALAGAAAYALAFRAVDRRYTELAGWLDGTSTALRRLARGDAEAAARAEIEHPELRRNVEILARCTADERTMRDRRDAEIDHALTRLASLGASLLEQLAEQSRLRDDHRANRRALDEAARVAADKIAQARTTAQFITTQAASAAGAVSEMNDALGRVRWAERDASRIADDLRDVAAHANAVALTASIEASRDGAPSAPLIAIAEELRELARLARDSAQSAREILRESDEVRAQGIETSQRLAARLDDFVAGIGLVNRLFEEIPAAQREHARLTEPLLRSEARQDELADLALATARESAAGVMRALGEESPPLLASHAPVRAVDGAGAPKAIANADYRDERDLEDPGDYLPIEGGGARARSES
ncbi:MAG: hypothetical protein IT350_21345 [Deltaproteobacteria bacterium]|nr:hypothetical protein [Deltaproteobacteria bacterium]